MSSIGMQTKALPFSVPVLSEQAETNLKKLILNLVVGRTAAELFSPIKQRPLTLCLMFLDAGNRKWLIKPELKLEVLEAVKRIKIIRDSGFEPDPNQIALLKKAAREVLADIPVFPSIGAKSKSLVNLTFNSRLLVICLRV